MTIGKRLYLNFGLILAILLGLFGANTWSLLREQSAKAEAVRSLEVARGMEAVRFQMMQNRMALQNYLLSGDTREVTRMNAGSTTLGELLKKAEGNALSDVQRNALVKVEHSEQDWAANFANRMIEKRKEVDAGNATVADLQVAYLTMDPETWVTKSTDPLDDAQAETARLLAERQKSDDSATRWTMIISVLCTMIALGLGVAIALRTSKSITEPLAHLIGVAREIGDSGDLNHKIDIQRQDEVGELGRTFANMVDYLKEMAVTSERIAGGDLGVDITPRSERDTLAHAFSKMTQSLRNTVSTVRDSAAQVAAGSNQVADASDESAKISVKASSAIDEVTSTMHEMTINVQNMVRNTQTQASSVSETSASIDEMVASIQRVADTAKVLLDISNRSREEVQNGISTMQKATEGLNRINESIGSSAGIIAELGARADDIGKIIEVIDDISEQTNLLALNAAIEAARAGEHGLGFAVVADEVRKLAEKSAQSTKEISELIQSIQKEARKAVDDMSRSTSIVNDGLTLGSDLSNALRKISSVVTEVYKFAQEIGAATNEQSHGSSQIAKATTRLNEITHEITSSVEEQAGGAQAVVRAMERMRELIQQTTSGSTELAASAEQMSKMSRSLLEAMDVFVLNGHNGNGNGNGRKAFSFENPEMPREGASRYAATARS